MENTQADIAAFLKQSQANWEENLKKAPIKGEYENLPDGLYVAGIPDITIGRNKADTRWQIGWKFLVLEGPSVGRTTMDFDGLDRPDSFHFIAKKLAIFGFGPEALQNMEKLPSVLNKIVTMDPKVLIRLRTKNGFQNVYIQKILPEDYEIDEATYSASEDDGGTSSYASTEEETPQYAISEDDVPVSEEAETAIVDDTETAPVASSGKDDQDDEELKIGMKVEFERKGNVLQGEVVALDEPDGSVDVKVGTRTYPVDVNKLKLVSEGTDA